MNDRTQRRKQAEQNRLYIIIGAGIAGAVLLLCVCGGVGLVVLKGGAGNAVASVTRPSAKNWTIDAHNQLFTVYSSNPVVAQKKYRENRWVIDGWVASISGNEAYIYVNETYVAVELRGDEVEKLASGKPFKVEAEFDDVNTSRITGITRITFTDATVIGSGNASAPPDLFGKSKKR